MPGRIIEIQEDGAYLSLYRGFMVISVDKKEISRIPLDDIDVLITNTYQLIYSHALLLELSKRNIVFIACGNNHLPVAIFWPIESHYQQTAIMKAQVASSEPITKQLWKKIIQTKIKFQQEVLDKAGIQHYSLLDMISKVQSGDIGNIEAQAAKRYWPLLFGKDFIRDISLVGTNSLLNYGYSIVRSGIARAVMAAGMHPAFGIFHRNRLNPMCLVDDLMEPYRPIVDWHVYNLDKIGIRKLTPETKKKLAGLLSEDCSFKDKAVPISVAMAYTAQSLSLCFTESSYYYLQLPENLLSSPKKKDA